MKDRRIYIVQSGEYFKIGMTSDLVEYRVKYMQIGNPVEIKIIAEYRKGNSSVIEKELHKIFIDKKVRGERFYLNKDDLQLIKKHCE